MPRATDTFRTELQRILHSEGRRQTWLAAQTGIGQTDMSRIVNGRLNPTDDEAAAIAEALGRKVDELGLTVIPARRAA